ncbi:MAG: hypothetical protein WDM88_11115 [Galbitalea sp.]
MISYATANNGVYLATGDSPSAMADDGYKTTGTQHALDHLLGRRGQFLPRRGLGL